MTADNDVIELKRPKARPASRRRASKPEAPPPETIADASAPGAATGQRVVKRVLVSSPKGGSGKTELSKGLAVAAAMSGLNVAVVDFDPQKSLFEWWQRRP